jgi:outer membrane receptor protein involved in Fe transport
MNTLRRLAAAALLLLVAAAPAFAQGTTGSIEGRISDEQGLALPGATVFARNTATGFARSVVTDATGIYRFPGLPIGTYEVKADLAGFATVTRKDAVVNVSQNTGLDFRMKVATKTEEISVLAEAPLIDTKSSGVGEVVATAQIENLPLNGRQFGNLAALVPGVSLGFHSDPTKTTQYAPQVNGGNGRNINYLIDGGDNNDDTVGGLVQNFPLDSIGEFNFQTQRFKAEYGRSNGGTLNVVTKSGTNNLAGSAFGYFRDKSLNARTETEKLTDVAKGEYRRYQFGGSLGGPIVKDKTHYFLSYERIHQNTSQSVDTLGLYPDKDGVYALPFREHIFAGKLTHQLSPNHYLSVRYGWNDNSQNYGASPNSPPESWGTSTNKFHSVNLNLNSSLGGSKVNEFVYQFSYFKNHIGENSTLPSESYPNGVFVGQSPNTPQTTIQHKWQFRDDLTVIKGRHELKVGASFIYEPVLDITFNSGSAPAFVHLEDDRNSPISSISYSGLAPGQPGSDTAKIPNKQYGFYAQDSWRVTDRLTLDLGVRYDLVTGFAFDQSLSVLYQEMTAAALAGKLQGVKGAEDFGKEPKEDKNNVAPRLGLIYDLNGDGSLVLRGGLGRYYDFGYTNANILFAVSSAQVPFGQVYGVDNTDGIRNPDGTLFRVGQPLPPNELGPISRPSFNHVASPLQKQPYTDQYNLGFARTIGKGLAFEMDGVWAEGHDLGYRPRINVRVNGGPRRFVGILPTFGNSRFRVDITDGYSRYKGINLALKKNWDGKLQFFVNYTLSKAEGTSRGAVDELSASDVLDGFNPLDPRQFGPTGVDARHRVNVSGVWTPGGGFTIAPVFRYRSKTPYNIIAATDLNRDGARFDLPPGVATVNAGRGSDNKQLDVRLSKKLPLGGHYRLEVLGEVFNVFNWKNPAGYVGDMAAGNFGQPTKYAGDFKRGEQLLAQFGVRFEF